MLNLRSGLIITAAALCLWALYSLLSSLKEPGLLRSQQATVLKGCDVLTDPEIRRRCVPLLCQKAVLDAKLVPWDSPLTVHTTRPSAAGKHYEVVIGNIGSSGQSFACLVHGADVPLKRVLDAAQLQEFIEAADEDPAEVSAT
jgi:hypothetical protein